MANSMFLLQRSNRYLAQPLNRSCVDNLEDADIDSQVSAPPVADLDADARVNTYGREALRYVQVFFPLQHKATQGATNLVRHKLYAAPVVKGMRVGNNRVESVPEASIVQIGPQLVG